MTSPNPREKMPPRVTDLQARARVRRRRVFILSIFSLIVLLSVFSWWILFHSSFFHFTRFVVEGNTRLTDQEVIDLLEVQVIEPSFWRRGLGRDNFFAWPGALNKETINSLGNIRGVRITKDYWNHELKIVVEERQFFGILCARKNELPQCLWFDKEGFFFEEAFFPDGFLVLYVDDYSRSVIQLGEFIYPSGKRESALAIFKIVKDLHLPVSHWTIREETPGVIEVQLIGGPTIYFSLKFPTSYMAQVTKSLIGQKGISNLQYIDFRTEGRVFYKDQTWKVN